VYVEATDQGAVLTAIRGVHGVLSSPRLEFVPLEDRPAVLTRHVIPIDGKWVRVGGRGRYRGDLGYVRTVHPDECTATILLVPRLPADGRRSQRGKKIRPPPRIFDPRLSGHPVLELPDGGLILNRDTYRGGLIQMVFDDTDLRFAVPTAEELDIFDRSLGMDVSRMAKEWSECSARALTPDSRVRVVSGELSGLIGRVLTITGGICQLVSDSAPANVIDIVPSDLRIHFYTGDYVRVKAGTFAGSVGWVTDVERSADLDIVTFIDEASKADKNPKEVSTSHMSTRKFI
jgi:transcription elongation factor